MEDAVSTLVGGVLLLVFVALGVIFYFLPAIAAKARRHHNSVAIFLLNLFAGWTLAGWVIALVWAFVSPPPSSGVER